MKKVFLDEFSSYEIKQLLKKPEEVVAICLFGACESHGDHCCLGPDTFVPTEAARRVAERLDKVVVVPCVPFGTSLGVIRHPMAISLRHETVTAIAEDIFESLIDRGITHIYILNGHGGNTASLNIAASKTKYRHPETKILHMPAWWTTLARMIGDRFDVWNGLGHGGEGETSIMMAVRPELVDLSKAEARIPEKVIRFSEKVNIVHDLSEVSDTGAIGDPTKASIEKGRLMMDTLVDLVADTIREMREMDWDYS
ncbi:MAG: creatininase family protein [Treponema sp.]|nr:creatininase family protein [Treponema sp.]